MDTLKQSQRKIFDMHAAEASPVYLALNRFSLKYPVRFKEEYLRKIMNRVKLYRDNLVLDIGCGRGWCLDTLSLKYGIRGIGIDISRNQLCVNLKNNIFNNLYCVSDAEEVAFLGGTFDFIICLDVLEHLSHPEKCIREASRLLKKNARALFYVISKKDRYTWHWFLRKTSLNRLGIDKGAKGWGDHKRENFLYPEDVIKFCKENGLDVINIAYIHSFFTLIYDEMIALLTGILKQRIKDNKDTNKFNLTARLTKKLELRKILLSFFNRIIFYPLLFLDMFWSKKGYSNGFFILVKK